MTFVFPLLLGGLALMVIPVLLHLIMRQKPKHLPFPAIRFLLLQHRANQRRLQLRHLLLLAIRMLLIAAIVLALARPKIFSERLNLRADRPVNAVLIFDTSYSMEYTSGNHTWLDEAKRRSLELLNDVPQDSRVAVFDTAEAGGEWLRSLSQARERINGLELRAANYPITAQLSPAYELLAKLDADADVNDEAPLRFLYVFSDRMQGCWNANHLENLQRLRDRIPAPGVNAIFVDVGLDNPAAVVLSEVKPAKDVFSANEPIEIHATVQAKGIGCNTEIRCKLDDRDPMDREELNLEPGGSRVVVFKRNGLTPGFHQAEVTLGTRGALPFASAGFTTFEVKGSRQVLIVTDDVDNARVWRLALESKGRYTDVFTADIKSTIEFRNNLFPSDLAAYKAICLMDVARPDKEVWDKLYRYIQDDRGLAIIPGADLDVSAYSSPEALKLMPAKLEKVVQIGSDIERGAVWSDIAYSHPLLARFGDWSRGEPVDFLAPGFEPWAIRYWEVELLPNQEGSTLVKYDGKKPALLLRQFAPEENVQGRVLLFSTALDDRHVLGGDQGPWNTYAQNTSFYLVLAKKAVGYLAGDAKQGTFNYQCGQMVPVTRPDGARGSFLIQGPGISSADAVLTAADNQKVLRITKATMPGNFRVDDAERKPVAWFSMNVAPDECQLTRVPKEQIEALFGPDALLPVDPKTSLTEALQNHWNQPVELVPWLLIFILLALAVENLLANKFYRKQMDEQEDAQTRAEPD
jgi:hypothetical protein